jgi:hypothetical protein
MAYDESIRSITLDADSSLNVYTGVSGLPGSPADHGGHQYEFVKITGARTCGLATAAANEVVVGVLQNKPQYLGNACSVAVSGVSQVRVGSGGLTAGAAVKVDSAGRGVVATLPTDIALVVGVCVVGATTADNIATVLLQTKG